MTKSKTLSRRAFVASGSALVGTTAVTGAYVAGNPASAESLPAYDADALGEIIIDAGIESGISLDLFVALAAGLPPEAVKQLADNARKLPEPYRGFAACNATGPANSVSPEMYQAIDRHRTANAAHTEYCEAHDGPEWDDDVAGPLGWAVWDAMRDLCALRPRYPGDNAARAEYLSTPGVAGNDPDPGCVNLEPDEIGALLKSFRALA